MTANERDILLMGIPRSGTTLVCQLLNRLPDVIALVEPIDFVMGAPSDRADIPAYLDIFIQETRQSIRNHSRAVSHHQDGVIASDMFEERAPGANLRAHATRRSEVEITKKLEDSFLLVLKHPAPFTALLDVVHQRYRCYAVIRNPLAVLVSWNSIAAPARDGHVPAAERFDATLAKDLRAIEDRIGRQLRILSWHCERYKDYLPAKAILRYEDIVATEGRCLSVMASSAAELHGTLEPRHRGLVQARESVDYLIQQLLNSEGAYWQFYARESVLDLAHGWRER